MGNPTRSTSQEMDETKDRLRGLMGRKDDIEAEMEGHRGRLLAENSTMNSPLVTLDGFPRDDIDVLAVRQARVRLIELRNDHKAVMSEIERALHQVIPSSSDSPRSLNRERQEGQGSGVDGTDVEGGEPFALVKSVDERGPAGKAGLKPDDLIVKFGSVLRSNNDGLKALAALVGTSEHKPIEVVVLRGEGNKERVTKTLVPQSGWGGRGMLGMHVVPL
ncbi:26S proteasome regulatory complex, subunit PSMD9 [Phaffia rhodozyma]|uniref:Probable 26S proteasome regulatory subunit p27 n=1 Tax=Phaffia rhodozyma TaxID=264483 RepID=A0A0F7SP01_PHARH|nr:26S proteasome regulatory complex, subunit PSMD9 [Phaffia rhodozyma]